MKEIASKKKIGIIAKAALAKKAGDVVLIDLRELESICDYFIIASGESTVQIDSIADNIERELLKSGCKVSHREGRKEALWILLDCGDIVAHVFHRDARAFYDLERLWYDAPQERIEDK